MKTQSVHVDLSIRATNFARKYLSLQVEDGIQYLIDWTAGRGKQGCISLASKAVDAIGSFHVFSLCRTMGRRFDLNKKKISVKY